MGNCKIVKQDDKKHITQFLNNNINLKNSNNTQPHITINDKQKIMYFVSDRQGGFGGLDIWLSIIDNNVKKSLYGGCSISLVYININIYII